MNTAHVNFMENAGRFVTNPSFNPAANLVVGKGDVVNRGDAVGLLTNDFVLHPVALCILSAIVQEFRPIGTGHNRRAQPFVAAANLDDKRQVVSASYNSPIGLYSTSNIRDALHGQLRGLLPSSPQP